MSIFIIFSSFFSNSKHKLLTSANSSKFVFSVKCLTCNTEILTCDICGSTVNANNAYLGIYTDL